MKRFYGILVIITVIGVIASESLEEIMKFGLLGVCFTILLGVCLIKNFLDVKLNDQANK